jgi:hypothetical protein
MYIFLLFIYILFRSDSTGDPNGKKWGKLCISDALKTARSVPRMIKAGSSGGGGVSQHSPESLGRRQPPVHSSSQEQQDLATGLTRVSSKRDKYLKVIYFNLYT